MNRKIINHITNFLAKIKGYKPETDNYEILKYYVTLYYLDGIRTISFIVISLVLNILPYSLLFGFVFGSIRHFARGFHSSSNTICTLVSFSGYLIGIYISIFFTINIITIIIIYVLCFLPNLVYAPAPTENSPIDDLEKPMLKNYTVIIMCLWFFVILIIGENTYRNIILTATILKTIFILPITYKILNKKIG